MEKKFLMFALLVAALVNLCRADVVLNALFSDSAVLQRDTKVPVWGIAEPGEKIIVKIDNISVSTNADQSGNWILTLPEHKAGGPYEMTVTGKNTITIKDVYFGDVWFCSGQSNMAMTVSGCVDAETEIKQATNSLIREFKVVGSFGVQQMKNLRGTWKVCSSATVGKFSATAYFFAKYLQPEIGVTIGIINSSVGGTRIEAWMSRDALSKIPEIKQSVEGFDRSIKEYQLSFEEYNRKLKEWENVAEQAKKQGIQVPEKPQPPKSVVNANSYSVLFNGMVAPAVPFPVKGILWYQGEANAGRNAYLYRDLLGALIDDWRRIWKQELPFIFVQLPNFGKVVDTTEDSFWAVLRESQLMVLKKPKTAMAVTIDIGEAGNIHPKNKQDVGKRLALAALGTVYGRKIVYSGPIYAGMNIEGNKIRIKFNHTGSGLVAKDSDTGEVKGFVIAGQDKKFVKAKAIIENETVVVWSDEISKPVAVRYAWAGNPVCNLYNKEGLPASPFRTDQ
ncbi:MAG TPA: sialate O-acetylesterase [bacterium]|nr:sialate O-acetylesterase [bacterium]HOL35456.1 sialate O-acetylesterase [bacterium]HPP07744.1 sialate O-acetylesterase [bacterium]